MPKEEMLTTQAGEKRPVLVTGAAGFVASHLVRRLLRDGYRVAVLIKKDTNTARIADVLSQLAIVYDDFSDQEQLTAKMRALNPSGVFHLAGAMIQSGVGATEDELIKVNTLGTVHLVKALEGVDYDFFVNTGSFLEYGTHELPLRESDICEPTEAYSVSKLAAALYCQAMARSTRKPIVTLRIFSAYGPEMQKGKLFYEVVRRALRNEDIVLTEPETSRDFIFIDDIVDLWLEAAEKAGPLAGQIFNAASGKATTFKELVERVVKVTGSKSVAKWGAVKSIVYDAGCMEANMEKTFKTFSWRPKYGLDIGIQKMVDWLSRSDS